MARASITARLQIRHVQKSELEIQSECIRLEIVDFKKALSAQLKPPEATLLDKLDREKFSQMSQVSLPGGAGPKDTATQGGAMSTGGGVLFGCGMLWLAGCSSPMTTQRLAGDAL